MNPTEMIERFLSRLAKVQSTTRGAVLLCLLAITIAVSSLPLIAQLELNSSWTALLPEDTPSVVDLKKIGDRLSGLTTLTIALEHSDTDTLIAFAKELSPALEELKPLGVRSVDANISLFDQFASEHRHLYAKIDDLEDLRDGLQQKLEKELSQVNPLFVSLDDGGSSESLDDILEKLEEQKEKASKKLEKFPEGFFVNREGNFLAIFLRTNIRDGNNTATERLIEAVSAKAESLKKDSFRDVEVNFGGSLVMALEEQQAIVQELAIATLVTIVLVFLAIWIFFRNFRVIPLLGLGMLAPVLLTFGFAELFVDYLNTSTAFLGSIVIGNGINPNIMWLARYTEERRDGKSLRKALINSHQETWIATFTASTAAAVAYGSLIITDFRGFRDFGIIGGIGMELCWIASLVFLPAWVSLMEKFFPFRFKAKQKDGSVYGRFFFSFAQRFPRSILWFSVATGALSFVIIVVAILQDPMEYDFRKLKSVRENSTIARTVNRKVGEIVQGMQEGNAIALLLPDEPSAQQLKKHLEDYRKKNEVVYGKIRSIDDFLPQDQDDKIEILDEIKDILKRLHPLVSEKDKTLIDDYMPPENLSPLDNSSLPQEIARPFTEKDGTRGRILFVEKAPHKNIWDGRFLMQWANEVRHFTLDSGGKPALAGRAPVFADMIRSIWNSTPQSIMASFVATLLLLFIAFRRAFDRTITIFTLLLGIGWMGASLVLLGEKMNFLNVLAFPITFGNGVDYGVNVMRRYSQESAKGFKEAIKISVTESGGAVVLCSLTTIIAYSSLYTSANQALNSFGLAMAVSEVTCVCAAMLTLPAAILYWKSRKQSVR
ncbi:MAG: MMPL family transporter [Myxococcales bacterium]|nr:MAG: MMPL family transporter [Myxococcales bacterium]